MESLVHLFFASRATFFWSPWRMELFVRFRRRRSGSWTSGERARVEINRCGWAIRRRFSRIFLSRRASFGDSGRETFARPETWIERASGGREIPLEAVAIRLDGKPLLSIHRPQKAFNERTQILQTARDSKRIHERLLKEIQKKEILLHCIIHDLSQPLAAMRGCFDCLAVEEGSAKAKEFVDIGKQQSDRQESMIREILRAFAEDLKAEMEPSGASADAPDLLRSARECVAAFTPVFAAKGAAIQLSPQIHANGEWKVAGEASRLTRIFSNLAENALRYAPRNSRVTIGWSGTETFFIANIDDEGPGLPKAARQRIFSGCFRRARKAEARRASDCTFAG